ncbi:LysR substrate-binding domain-containing protein [Klebsiella michiganensis]|uniref:LysR substrate-binding domain-containing protein n=1 Tax=Klebsiella michiganensis TaxID=1134687 RepID=UPI00224851A3|nr:LysR substrate-binding domain-containing protein [Klebsiella michiganensis]MCW9508880.1 LysR substrate-binding domain-containing protein [Klebsiella michiganensis]
MPVLATLCAEYPALRLDITFTDRRVELIEENIDLAVRLGDTGNSASLAGRKIATQRSVICASPAYINRHGLLGRAEELLSHACLALQGMAEYCPGKCWMKMAAWSCLNPLSVTLSVTGRHCGMLLSGGRGLPFCQHGWPERKSLKRN